MPSITVNSSDPRAVTKIHLSVPADRPETRPLAERYASVVPAEGSVVDLLVRARDRQTGQPLKTHQIVAQVSGQSCSMSVLIACRAACLSDWPAWQVASAHDMNLGLFVVCGWAMAKITAILVKRCTAEPSSWLFAPAGQQCHGGRA